MTTEDRTAPAEGPDEPARHVALRGQIDLARREDVCETLAPLRFGTGDALIDLSGVTFMDSSGLSALAVLARDLRPSGRRVVCVGARRPVERLIRLAGIDTVVDLRSRDDMSRDDARDDRGGTACDGG